MKRERGGGEGKTRGRNEKGNEKDNEESVIKNGRKRRKSEREGGEG